MKAALVSDIEVSRHSLFSQLPKYCSCDAVSMQQFSAAEANDFSLVIVDLTSSTRPGLENLRYQLGRLIDVRVLFLVTPGQRWENVQANSFGNIEVFDRRLGVKGLVELVCKHQRDFLTNRLPQSMSEVTRRAFLEGSDVLDSLMHAIAFSEKIPVSLLKSASESLTSALQVDGLMVWVQAVAHHHSGTYRHSLHVAGLTAAFTAHLGWSVKKRHTMAAGALLHDIGKMRIPLAILDKPGRLTKDEFDLIKKHPVFGRQMLEERGEIPIQLKLMAYQHHEYLDGSGYPEGIGAEDLDPQVRVLTICDIFSAMTEVRAYKEAFSPRVAFTELVKMGGKLDQALVRKFQNVVLDMDLGRINRGEAPNNWGCHQGVASLN